MNMEGVYEKVPAANVTASRNERSPVKNIINEHQTSDINNSQHECSCNKGDSKEIVHKRLSMLCVRAREHVSL